MIWLAGIVASMAVYLMAFAVTCLGIDQHNDPLAWVGIVEMVVAGAVGYGVWLTRG